MTMVVVSILERDADTAAARIREVPRACGLVEIRGDYVDAGELAGLVSGAGRPVIATVRRVRDGGDFDGSEDERRAMILGALDAGAALADVEHGGALADLAEGERADRLILSHHGAPCREDALRALHREMASTRAGKLKIVPSCERVSDVVAIRDLLREAAGANRLACFGLGRLGSVSRLLAPSWGSWGTYASPFAGAETAEGQFAIGEMLDLHDVASIGPGTKLFALVGRSVRRSPSPAMHRAAYLAADLDARYLPIEADDAGDVLSVAGPGGPLGIEGLAVTMPFKSDACGRCRTLDDAARTSGAVNTVVGDAGAWSGHNTDGPAVLAGIARRMAVRGARVAVLGAGGFASAAAAVLRDAGADVVLFARTLERAQAVARRVGARAETLDVLARFGWNVLINGTPLGLDGEDAAAGAPLVGRLVMDAVYGPETPLLRRARREGLDTVDGSDLLLAQALPQFALMTGVEADEGAMRRAGRAWLQNALTGFRAGHTLGPRR